MWDRKLWGVELSGPNGVLELIGQTWTRGHIYAYPGEPSRALLFMTRKAARQWCVWKMGQYAGRTDCCAAWRFRPVRVREVVTKEE